MKYIQASVSWNKSFKAKVSEEYDEWLSIDGIKNLTDAGNLKSPSHFHIVEWILNAWKELTPELVSRFIKAGALSISVDRSKDDAIHCLKAGQPCEKGFSMFKDQLPALNEPEINPFVGIEGPQDEEQLPLFMVVDEDEDNDIDIKL